MSRRILPLLALAAAVVTWARRRLVAYEIAEHSMEPALAPGDWVLGLGSPRRLPIGAVVVYRDPAGPGLEIVKRIASAPRALAPGELWLLGDNPGAGSMDSRTLGPIPREWVAARLFLRYHPAPPHFLLRKSR